MSVLASLTSAQTKKAGRVLVVPLGATEQHGPHLPLGTDTIIASELASRLAAVRPQALVAPALAYGSSGEHQSYAGTISIGRSTTHETLVELVRSAVQTFPRILLLSAHGGNAVPVNRAVIQLRGESRDVLAWDPARTWRGDAHAGLTETSVMLAINPGAVDMARAAAGNTLPLAQIAAELQRAGVESVSPNGVLGDPTGATPELGQSLLAKAVESLVRFIEDWPAD